MLLAVTILHVLSEIVGYSLIGQGVLWLVAGQARENNFAYKMLSAVTRPAMWLGRTLMPRFVMDRHIWLVATLLVIVIWFVAGQQRLRICVTEASTSPLCAQLL